MTQSHGFRKGRGPITFFFEVQRWGQVDRLIKADVVKCFDNIDHGLLISAMQSYLGEENASFYDLILQFVRTPIIDKKDMNIKTRQKESRKEAYFPLF